MSNPHELKRYKLGHWGPIHVIAYCCFCLLLFVALTVQEVVRSQEAGSLFPYVLNVILVVVMVGLLLRMLPAEYERSLTEYSVDTDAIYTFRKGGLHRTTPWERVTLAKWRHFNSRLSWSTARMLTIYIQDEEPIVLRFGFGLSDPMLKETPLMECLEANCIIEGYPE